MNLNLNSSTNKYLTYNKYNNPLGALSPMLRLKTFNVDTKTENSAAVKEYAMKRRSLIQDEDPQVTTSHHPTQITNTYCDMWAINLLNETIVRAFL